jgi:phytoene desaturase
MDTIVIGAGIGGIAVAGRLARAGHKVTVVEKADHPGGRASFIQKDGYRFDTGPTLLLMPEVFAETYAALGERMQDHLDLVHVDPTYRAHFHDDTSLDLTYQMPRMREQLDALEPGAFGQFLRFMAEGYSNYNLGLDKFVGRNFYSLAEYFDLRNLPLLLKMKALMSHASNTKRYFKDSRLQAAFSFQNMYLGLSPYEAPATYSLLQYTELGDGVWFPKGGMYRPIESLAQIAAGLGVRFEYGTAVKQINVEGNRTSGVTLEDGKSMCADLVVANADLPYVYSALLPEDGTAAQLQRKKYTSSALMFYWGVKGGRSPELLHHNVFLADDEYRASFETIFHDLSLPQTPSFYVNAPTRTDASFAPSDGDALMVLVPVGHINEAMPQDWAGLRARARNFLIKRLEGIGVKDLRNRIVLEETMGPPEYLKDLNLAKGSAFGLSHNFTQIGYLRPHNRHPRYKNLYFAGASTHPGTGLPIVLLSAKLTAERIMKELAEEKKPSRSLAQPTLLKHEWHE